MPQPYLCVTGESAVPWVFEFDYERNESIASDLHKIAQAEVDRREVLREVFLSKRTQNVLLRSNLLTFGLLRTVSPQRILRLSQCGRVTRQEIIKDIQEGLNIPLPNWVAAHEIAARVK